MINIFNIFKEEFIIAVKKIAKIYNIDIDQNFFSNVVIEPCKDQNNGDLATNIAMVLVKNFKETDLKNPRLLAQIIINNLNHNYIAKVDIAGPGFINVKVKDELLQKVIYEYAIRRDFEFENYGQGLKINLEYASPNPTGPIHVGHTRGAIYGDVLARLLEKVGYDVLREYYINDAGSQIDTLLESAYLRYLQLFDDKIDLKEGLYPGEYLIDIAHIIKDKFDDKLVNQQKSKSLIEIRDLVVNEMLKLIKTDLLALKIKHDSYFSEKKELHDKNKINEVINLLRSKGLIYEGYTEIPISQKSQILTQEKQTLFRSTDFGDDQDRVVLKSDGNPTYFAGDIAYTKSKIDRGAKLIIMPLGYDHAGYVKRLTAVNNILSENTVEMKIILCQMVKFIKNGEPLKMSKRAGNFITARQVIDEIGSDVLRFIMLTRKNDALFDFDLQKVVEQSKDNPIFYVQYAHARCCSVLRNLKRDDKNLYDELINLVNESSEIKFEDFIIENNFLINLKDSSEIDLMLRIANFPRIIEMAVKNFEPHRIAFYLQDLAASFHGLWNKGSEDLSLKFINLQNINLTKARIFLIISLKNVIATALDIFSINAIEEMK